MKRRIYKSTQNRHATAITYQRKSYLLLAIPAMVVVVVVCLFSYIIMTSLTVLNTAKRANYGKQIAVKNASLTELETRLSAIDKSITPVLASAKGFMEVSPMKYITTKSIKSAMRGNELEL